MTAASPSDTAEGQCVGLSGASKAWRGNFTSDCLECDSDPVNANCEIEGSVELVCCKNHSTNLPDQSTLIINLFKYNDFTVGGLISSSSSMTTCDFQGICGQLFEGDVEDDWLNDCVSGTCNGIYGSTITIYDPDDTPDSFPANCDGLCADISSVQFGFGTLRMPMVALDAKTGKPLSFIVEESSSE